MLISVAGGYVIGRRSSGKQGIELLFDGPDDADSKAGTRESGYLRSVRIYMNDIARHPLLSKEQVTQIFEEICFWRDSIDSLILTTRYGRR
ncbi:MAG: hypothetical protein KKD17_06410 [Nanoarchaeota archaeon]|nr:hypothetical protein [Nanoarchaeota archaeon]